MFFEATIEDVRTVLGGDSLLCRSGSFLSIVHWLVGNQHLDQCTVRSVEMFLNSRLQLLMARLPISVSSLVRSQGLEIMRGSPYAGILLLAFGGLPGREED